MTGKVGNAVPRAEDDRVKVDAAKINMTMPGPKLRAEESVTTVLKPAKAGAGSAKTKLPGIMQQDQQVNGRSDKLNYNGDTSAIEFSGNATLWQGETKIQAPAIQVDGATGNLSASGGVRSWMPVQDKTRKKDQQRRSRAAFDRLTYETAAKVTYAPNANLLAHRAT